VLVLAAFAKAFRAEDMPATARAPARPARTARRMRIVGARLGKPIRYPKSHGDLWTTTWADDDNLYTASNDTLGFNRSCSSNLAVHRLTGKAPPELRAVTVNPMKAFGGWGEVRKEDGAMWKACGLACVDGVLYLSVSRHANPSERSFQIQQAWDASILKSTDHGKSWSPAPKLARPMFPGPTFATPFFVDYGKDTRAAADAADRFVYAISNDGSWNNGNSMTLGRVPRDRIGRLDAGDWEFVNGFDGGGQPVWKPRLASARYVFRAPGHTSQASVHYVAPLGLYVLLQWHYTHLNDAQRRWQATRFEFYQAPAPWSPWSRFHVQDFEPEGWYDPRLVSKFVSADGRRWWIFVAGDWTTSGTLDGYYGLHMIPVTLDVDSVRPGT
jgi:hypothetical protein